MNTRVKLVRSGFMRPLFMLLSALLLVFLVTFSALAWRTGKRGNSESASSARNTPAPPVQGTANGRNRMLTRLTLQPEADRFRRRLGQRFLAAGREVAVWLGTVTQGTTQFSARITRSQEEEGEQVTVSLNNGATVFTWNGREGAKAGSQQASGSMRALVERLVFDSPDQFVLAQMRGASYFRAASMVRPAVVGGATDYTGPVWDVIRVGEPVVNSSNNPLAAWRLYYINLGTGLIDKTVSQEEGQPITAEFSGWGSQGGELTPTRVVWKQNRQVVMELTLNSISHQAKQ